MDVQDVREAREKPVSVFMKFCQAKDIHGKALFCFFEGEDVKYYGCRIEEVTGISCDNIISYSCGGKAGVLRVKDLIKAKNQYDNVKTAYFIDRDFFPQKHLEKDVYQTTGYAVENYYTSSAAFKKILSYAFCIPCYSSDYKKCIKDYEQSMNLFHKHVLLLNAWIKAQRVNELKTEKVKIKLRGFKVSKYFKVLAIDEVKIKEKIDKSLLENFFCDSCIVDDSELEKYMLELEATDMQQTFRGKYELEFLQKMIDDLRGKNKTKSYFSEKYDFVKIDPNVDALSSLNQYADTPKDLIEFLRQFSIDRKVV